MRIKVITTETKWTSWEELKAFSEAGKLGEVLKSGDNIPVTLKNGEKVSFDVGKDESGKVYFIMHDCMEEPRPMNRGWTNKGGWAESDMRKYLNEEVIELLSDELKEAIKPTKIVQVWDGKRRETEDKLFLLSRTQACGKDIDYEAIEPNDSPIDIFENPEAYIKETEGCETSCYWWLRTPCLDSDVYFCHISMEEIVDYDDSDFSIGVVPAFCI